MSRCFPYPPPGYGKKKKNLSLSNGEGEAEEPQREVELELGYPDKNAKHKDKNEKKKKHKEKNNDEQRLETEKSEKKHKRKPHKHKKDNRKDKDIDHNKQKNKDDIKKVLTRDRNGGHVFEDKNGVVYAKSILDKVESEPRKFCENIQNGKCCKIYPLEIEGTVQNLDKERKSQVESRKFAGIDGLKNGKCDMIDLCTKSNGTGNKRKKMETTSSSHVESAERLKNGKLKKIDQLDTQGSRQKVIKETVRDNEIARDKEILKDVVKSEGTRKKRKKMDTTSPTHGNGLWTHLPLLTDKDKWSIKRPRIELTGEVYCGNGTTAQEANVRALGCAHESEIQDASNAAVEKCIANACHLPVDGKDCEQNGKADCKTISHAFAPSYCNAEAVDAIPSRTRAENHVQDFNYFYSVPAKLDWSDVDDQEWLFHSSGGNPKTAVKVDHVSNVWAQALHLQPNLYALPYVIHL